MVAAWPTLLQRLLDCSSWRTSHSHRGPRFEWMPFSLVLCLPNGFVASFCLPSFIGQFSFFLLNIKNVLWKSLTRLMIGPAFWTRNDWKSQKCIYAEARGIRKSSFCLYIFSNWPWLDRLILMTLPTSSFLRLRIPLWLAKRLLLVCHTTASL